MRDAFEELKKKKVTVFGISKDRQATQKKFVNQHKLPYDLITDSDGEIAKALGVPMKLGGRIMARQAYLFKNKKLVWKDENGATKTQGEDVLKVIESM